jgi:hypothetical protein
MRLFFKIKFGSSLFKGLQGSGDRVPAVLKKGDVVDDIDGS